MINKKEVAHIAKLARLGLTEKELVKMGKDLSSILGYVEKLKKADIDGVNLRAETLATGAKTEQGLREDKISEKRKAKSEKLIEAAPETKNGYLKVKSIL